MTSNVFNQANAIVDTVRNNMAVQHNHLVQTMVELQTNRNEAPITSNQAVTPTISNVSTDATQVLLLKLLQDLQSNMPPKRNGGNRNNCLRHYCWTHGHCNHKSSECRNKKKGHKDDATLQDKKGGSTKNCNPQQG